MAVLFAAASPAQSQRADTTAPRQRDRNEFDSRWLSLRLGVALVVDASAFSQNDDSDRQVGDIANVGRFRFARGILSGAINAARPWDYLVSIDASGLYANDSPLLTVNDLALTIPIGGHAHLAIGRQKEGVTEQMMSPSRGIPFAERAAPVTVFVPTRNDGVRLWGSVPRTHAGWTAGLFNDALFNALLPARQRLPGRGPRVLRAHCQHRLQPRAVQLAIDARWSGDQDGTLAYKSQPENNEAPNFIDTKSFGATTGLTGDAELIVLHDNLSFSAEALPTQASGTSMGTATFFAYYAELSWRPGGETRPYNEETGTPGRVRVDKRRFAWELAARFSHSNLTSGPLDGGVLDILGVSLGGYGPSSTRVLLDCGFSVLRKSGVTGRAVLTALRFQWELP